MFLESFSAVHSTVSYPCAQRSRILLTPIRTIHNAHFQVNVCTSGLQRVDCSRHVLWLISNVFKNSNTWPLYRDTMPSRRPLEIIFNLIILFFFFFEESAHYAEEEKNTQKAVQSVLYNASMHTHMQGDALDIITLDLCWLKASL